MVAVLQARRAALRTALHIARRTRQARHIQAAHHVVAIRQVHLAVATRQDRLPQGLPLRQALLHAEAATLQVASSAARLQRAAEAAALALDRPLHQALLHAEAATLQAVSSAALHQQAAEAAA